MILAGIDEAGLGPNLGPLVTASAVLEAPDAWDHASPWRGLAAAVAERHRRGESRLAVADSKLVHAAGGVAALESAVGAFCACLDGEGGPGPAVSFSGFPSGLPPARYPWHSRGPNPYPCSATGTAALAAALAGAGAAIRSLEASLLHPGEMNRLYADGLNKNEILLRETGRRLAALAGRHAGKDIWAMVDKQGGRNDYLPFLTRLFPGTWIETLTAGAGESTYRLRPAGTGMTVSFMPKADRRSFTTALASMTAKYVRERAMAELNAWFGGRVPSLKPTAGYPADARRWLAGAEAFLAAEGIDVDLVWRRR